jgi:MYXO-CTERM domain-containing protein
VSRFVRNVLAATSAFAALAAAAPASAITRDEVLTRARTFASHPWHATAANKTATCSAAYTSLFDAGDYVGVAYDWGGYMSLWEFDRQIVAGLGAGSQQSDGVLACTVGLDCSGFVSQAWNVGHFTTSTLDQTSAQIAANQLLTGDVFNMSGYHVAMYTHTLASGQPAMIEALGVNVHTNTTGGWSHVNGYLPRRLNSITGTTATVPMGTATTPIPISTFPFTDSRDTRLSTSKLFDACGASPTTNQSGPEYVYTATFTQPGTLTLAVSDDATSDIDVQLLTSLNTKACVARADASLTQTVGCGTYYVLADTYAAAAGNYTLTATFTPSGQPCSAVPGPPAFNPQGKLGTACSYPGNQSLPYCNPNLEADTCIYTSNDSFCSKPCATNNDCGGMPAGSCCQDIGNKEFYCVTASLCGAGGGVTGTNNGPDAGPVPDGGTSSAGNGGGKDAGAGAGIDGGEEGDPTNGAAGDDTPVAVNNAEGCSASSAAARNASSGAPVFMAGALAIVALRRRRRMRA